MLPPERLPERGSDASATTDARVAMERPSDVDAMNKPRDVMAENCDPWCDNQWGCCDGTPTGPSLFQMAEIREAMKRRTVTLVSPTEASESLPGSRGATVTTTLALGVSGRLSGSDRHDEHDGRSEHHGHSHEHNGHEHHGHEPGPEGVFFTDDNEFQFGPKATRRKALARITPSPSGSDGHDRHHEHRSHQPPSESTFFTDDNEFQLGPKATRRKALNRVTPWGASAAKEEAQRETTARETCPSERRAKEERPPAPSAEPSREGETVTLTSLSDIGALLGERQGRERTAAKLGELSRQYVQSR